MDDLNKMQGMSQQQQIDYLKLQGIPEQQAMELISQNQIKQAVTGGTNPQALMQPNNPADQDIVGQGPPTGMSGFGDPLPPDQFPGGPAPGMGDPMNAQGNYQAQDPFGGGFAGGGFPGGAPSPGQQDPYSGPFGGGGGEYGAAPMGDPGGEYAGMQPSLMTQGAPQGGESEQEYVGGPGVQDPYGSEAYSMYQPYQEAMGSDMITEISEQIVDEKLSVLHDKIEKILDMRTIVEANMINLNDRLKRMEKIIDQVQVSLLKKFGEYLTDVQDVKKELEETQKSFVSIHKGKKHHKSSKKK
ncbi:MAG: hypothetical protein KKE05_04795 [Nanoarchaeota archaeon]|nr:hypothetical protein [Nanoarchaeota archaeon]